MIRVNILVMLHALYSFFNFCRSIIYITYLGNSRESVWHHSWKVNLSKIIYYTTGRLNPYIERMALASYIILFNRT